VNSFTQVNRSNENRITLDLMPMAIYKSSKGVIMRIKGNFLIFLITILCSVCLGTYGNPKLCPWTRAFLGNLQGTLIENRMFSIYDDPIEGLSTGVFIKTDGSPQSVEVLRNHGILPSTIAGDFLTARISIDKIPLIAQLDEVLYIQVTPKGQLLNDRGRTNNRVDKVHRGDSPLPRAYRGAGSLVGVIDGGIDWAHPDFKSGGITRIRYIWDQTVSGTPPSGFSYGREWTSSQINSGLCTEFDGEDGGGHGTHVTGSAAGNGAASGGTYAGMAPESEIIFVKTTMDFDHIVDATNYCFRKAAEIGKPISVNLSIGAPLGPRDGTFPISTMISELTGPGKIISISAGNDNGNYSHVGYSTSYEYWQGTNLYAPTGNNTWIDIWYPASGNITFCMGFYSYFWDEYFFSPEISPGEVIHTVIYDYYYNPLVAVYIDATETTSPLNGDRNVIIYIGNQGPSGVIPSINLAYLVPNLWTLGSGRFDAWISNGWFDPTLSGSPWVAGDNRCLILAPADARNGIAVGSYDTRATWTDVDGSTHTDSSVIHNNISSFSCNGPTRDGRIKPDITAPGNMIISTLSSEIPAFSAYRPLMINAHYWCMQGTSMASPMVTGAIALLLERDPSLTPSELRSILTTCAVSDYFTGSCPNNAWGYGKLDVFPAMSLTDIEYEVKLNKPTKPFLGNNFPNPFNSVTNIGYYLPEDSQVELNIYDLNGRLVHQLVNEFQTMGSKTVKYYPHDHNGDEMPSGLYFCKLRVGDHAEISRISYIK